MGKDVSYDHLRVFGCRAFFHIPKDERSKMTSQNSVSSWVMHMKSLVTDYGIR